MPSQPSSTAPRPIATVRPSRRRSTRSRRGRAGSAAPGRLGSAPAPSRYRASQASSGCSSMLHGGRSVWRSASQLVEPARPSRARPDRPASRVRPARRRAAAGPRCGTCTAQRQAALGVPRSAPASSASSSGTPRRPQRQHRVRPAGEPVVGTQQPAADCRGLGRPPAAAQTASSASSSAVDGGGDPGERPPVQRRSSTRPSPGLDHGRSRVEPDEVADDVAVESRGPSRCVRARVARTTRRPDPTRLQHERHTRARARSEIVPGGPQ